MRDDEDTTAAPAIPVPRPVGEPWAAPADAGGRGAALFIGAVGAVVVLAASLLAVFGRGGEEAVEAQAAPSAVTPTIGHNYAPAAATPYDNAVAALRMHAGALVDGNEAGWMAAVDPGKPALVERYHGLFRTLRGLGVTRFEYTSGISVKDKKDPATFTFPTRVDYCFGADTCGGGYPASIGLSLTMKPVGGRYVITAVADHPDPDNLEPVPWQDGKLQLVQGQRVVVGAEAGEAKYLATMLPIAEKAAAADDRFATLLLAKQTKYRVFLAGEKQWKKWYGGEDDDWLIGLAVPISQYGYDVVLRVHSLDSAEETRVTLQHEFGHVITLTGSETFHRRNRWLSEGIAEYIGWSPKHAADSYRKPSVAWAIGRRKPTSMIPADPGPKASARAGDAYYGLSHFAVDCMAQKYGQPNMIRFVRLVLLRDESYDAAARDAFHQPFATVDQACAAWIRQKA